MIITNDFDLPEEFVDLQEEQSVGFDPDKKIIRVTKLIGSPQAAVLGHRFGEMRDASESLFMLMGTGVHKILEERNRKKTDRLVESTYETNIDGWSIRGTIDLMLLDENGKVVAIKDYKVTSTWTVVFESYEKYIAQLNVYKYIVQQHLDCDIKTLEANLIMRDWQKSKAEREANYPRIGFQRVKVPIWDDSFTLEYIRSQIRRLELINSLSDKDLLSNVFCTPEERLSRPDKFAVMKNNNKTAAAVCQTADEAFEYIQRKQIEDPKSVYKVEIRKGEDLCLKYCPVRHVCGLAKGAKIVEVENGQNNE